MFKRVLLPLDGSMLAESALEPALHLAQQAMGTVYLMRVPVYLDNDAQISPEYQRAWKGEEDFPNQEDVSAYLRKTQEKLQRSGVLVKTIIGEGEPADAVLNTADTKKIDLIVMASHARSGVSRWLLGSVSGQIIRKAHIPVMLIRRPIKINHILITLDGSDLAGLIVEPALALAADFGCRVTFLQVLETNGSADEDEEITNGASYLNLVQTRHVPSNLDVNIVVKKGSATEEILSYAAQNEVDLIAMSTHGRSGLWRLFSGSVTEKVMCDSGLAMLIIRPQE
jgi:nucleotide-binding universal stress UspA family protein